MAMQVSFHKYGDFFPGTGCLQDIGHGAGIHYSVNVPLAEGMDDASYQFVYEPVMAEVRGLLHLCGGGRVASIGCLSRKLVRRGRCL